MDSGDANGSESQQKVPFRANIKGDQRYRWCACGLSANQPFCDDSHVGTKFLPVLFKQTEDLTVALCGCKQTKRPPYCDGSHVHLATGENR